MPAPPAPAAPPATPKPPPPPAPAVNPLPPYSPAMEAAWRADFARETAQRYGIPQAQVAALLQPRCLCGLS